MLKPSVGKPKGQRSTIYYLFLQKVFTDKNKFLSAEELKSLIIEEFRVTDSNARKIIERAVDAGVIRCSAPISFDRNQYVYFGNKFAINVNNFKRICERHRPNLYYLISVMELNGGIISCYEAQKICACPIIESSTKVNSLDDLIGILNSLDIAKVEEDEKGIKYLVFVDCIDVKTLLKKHYVRMLVDSAFIPDILYWLQKVNLIDNSNIVYRNKNFPNVGARHNNLLWDAFAYTNTTGITAFLRKDSDSNDKKTLVTLDVIMSREYSEMDLKGFYNRVQIIRNSTKNSPRKIMPLIFCKMISEDTYNKVKKLGFLLFNVGVMYGEKIYNLIENLQLVKMEQIANDQNSSGVIETIEQSLSLIKSSGQEANLENIKGDLFESLIYHLIKEIYPSASIQPNKKLSGKNIEGNTEYYEYDYIIRADSYKEIIILELKGYKSYSKIKIGDKDTRNTLMWFFGRTYPFAKRILHSDEIKITGCYMTTAKFEEGGYEWLNNLNESVIKPTQLDVYYDGEKLKKILESKGLSRVIAVIEKYYNQ